MEGDFGLLKIRKRPRKSEWGVDESFGDMNFDLGVSRFGVFGYGAFGLWLLVWVISQPKWVELRLGVDGSRRCSFRVFDSPKKRLTC